MACSDALRGLLTVTENRVPRSTLSIMAKPQLCRISLALLDHGEIVPGLGTTTRVNSKVGSKTLFPPLKSTP